MIWIIGEYAERIDNAAELLESFLEGFQDENTQVCSFDLIHFIQLYTLYFSVHTLQTHHYSNWDEIPWELIKDEKLRTMRNSHVGIHIQEYKIAKNLTVRPI